MHTNIHNILNVYFTSCRIRHENLIVTSLFMDESKKFLQNVAHIAGKLDLNHLERTTMAYKRLCLELESMSNEVTPAVTPPTSASASPPTAVSPNGLRASASEFVPQVPVTSDRIPIEMDNDEQDDDSDDDGYDEERKRAPKPAIYGIRFYNHHYESDDVSENHLQAEKKRKLGYRTPKFRPNQPTCRSPKSETDFIPTAKPPPELANGQPHFNGPYMPLLQHRIANAEAYGLIQGSDERNSLLLDDMVKQLARLDNCPVNLSSLFPKKGDQKPEP
uniref:IP11792p n=2 Tax=Drosophila melanogaster TaxID=7227 RepID=Q4V614_DROME|nr:CG43317-PA [synthetic construct]